MIWITSLNFSFYRSTLFYFCPQNLLLLRSLWHIQLMKRHLYHISLIHIQLWYVLHSTWDFLLELQTSVTGHLQINLDFLYFRSSYPWCFKISLYSQCTSIALLKTVVLESYFLFFIYCLLKNICLWCLVLRS